MEPTRKISPLWAVAPLAVLVFAGFQTAATLSRTPAFNRALRVEAPDGGTLPRFLAANYSGAAYYYRIALEWYNQSDGVPPENKDDLTPAEERARGDALRIRDIANESLKRSPGDPTTWMLIAKAEAALGNGEAALRAYRVSNDLAPHEAALAVNRLYFLVSFMSRPEQRDLAQTSISPQAVQTDLEAMRNRPSLAPTVQLLSSLPAMAAFLNHEAGGE